MQHNPNLVMMGSHGSTDMTATEEVGVIAAGLVAHKKSDGTVTVLSADGQTVGVSLGETLDGDTTKCSVVRSGNLIPVQVTAEAVRIGNVDFLAKVAGVSVQITAGATAGSEVVTVADKKITIQIEAAASTATQVAAAVMASAPALLLLTSAVIQSGQGATAQAAPVAETAITLAGYVVPGAAFKFSATTGKATSGGTTSGAIFSQPPSGDAVKVGRMLDGSSVFCAYIDMGGGL